MTTEIRNEAESRFRILSDAKFRGLTGISMGGFGAFTIGTLYPDLYSSVASHMGAVNDEALEALKTLTPEQLEKYDFYLDCGLQDGMVDYQWTVNIHEYLQSVGKEHGYDLRDGGHNSAFYMAGMPASMKMHSDHFLKNGLYDAELQSEGGVFDLNPDGEAHQDLWIQRECDCFCRRAGRGNGLSCISRRNHGCVGVSGEAECEYGTENPAVQRSGTDLAGGNH